MKRNLAILLVLVILVGCSEKNNNTISLESHELFDEDNPIAQIHINNNLSEYLKIDYEGNTKYNLSFQMWKNGEITASSIKILDLELAQYSGISFELEEISNGYEIVIGTYSDSEILSGATFPLDIAVSEDLWIVESSIGSKSNEDDNEILLYGFHMSDHKSEIQKIFEDGYEAARNSDESILFVLTPIDDVSTKQSIEVYNLIGSESRCLLFSSKDIKTYDWDEQKVYFNDNIKIPDEMLGLFKDPYIGSEIFKTGNHDRFLLYVNEELIYEGYYTQSVASSFMGMGMTMVDELDGVSFEYGGIVGGEDYRFDQRIYDALEVNELLGD